LSFQIKQGCQSFIVYSNQGQTGSLVGGISLSSLPEISIALTMKGFSFSLPASAMLGSPEPNLHPAPTRMPDHYNHIPSCPATILRTILQNQILIRHFQQLPLTFPDAPT
jgi:hypothetical protein